MDTTTRTTPSGSAAPSDAAAQYETANRALLAVLDAVAPDAWSLPSPCEDWTARDVVGHLVETQRDFLERHDLSLGGAPDVDADLAAVPEPADRTARVLARLGRRA